MVNLIRTCTLAVIEYAYSYILLIHTDTWTKFLSNRLNLGTYHLFFFFLVKILIHMPILGRSEFECVADGCSSRGLDHTIASMVFLLN